MYNDERRLRPLITIKDWIFYVHELVEIVKFPTISDEKTT